MKGNVAKDYKDRLFRMIFNDREKLLELYNAMNDANGEEKWEKRQSRNRKL